MMNETSQSIFQPMSPVKSGEIRRYKWTVFDGFILQLVRGKTNRCQSVVNEGTSQCEATLGTSVVRGGWIRSLTAAGGSVRNLDSEFSWRSQRSAETATARRHRPRRTPRSSASSTAVIRAPVTRSEACWMTVNARSDHWSSVDPDKLTADGLITRCCSSQRLAVSSSGWNLPTVYNISLRSSSNIKVCVVCRWFWLNSDYTNGWHKVRKRNTRMWFPSPTSRPRDVLSTLVSSLSWRRKSHKKLI